MSRILYNHENKIMENRIRSAASACLAVASLITGCHQKTETVDTIVTQINKKTGEMRVVDQKKIDLAQASKDVGAVGIGVSLLKFSTSATAAEIAKPLGVVLKTEVAESVAGRVESMATSRAMKVGALAIIGTGIYLIVTSGINHDSKSPGRAPTPQETDTLARAALAEQIRAATYLKTPDPAKTSSTSATGW